jgi:predicted RNA-binding protein with TRAM domain
MLSQQDMSKDVLSDRVLKWTYSPSGTVRAQGFTVFREDARKVRTVTLSVLAAQRDIVRAALRETG